MAVLVSQKLCLMSLKLFNFNDGLGEMSHFEDESCRTLNFTDTASVSIFGFHIISIFMLIAQEYFSIMYICAVRST
jgi:hypothetical protein